MIYNKKLTQEARDNATIERQKIWDEQKKVVLKLIKNNIDPYPDVIKNFYDLILETTYPEPYKYKPIKFEQTKPTQTQQPAKTQITGKKSEA